MWAWLIVIALTWYFLLASAAITLTACVRSSQFTQERDSSYSREPRSQ